MVSPSGMIQNLCIGIEGTTHPCLTGDKLSALQADYAPRERLTLRLAGARVGLVWAAGGYGKSTLAGELRDALAVTAFSVRLWGADRDPGRLAARVRAELRRARRSDALAAMEAEGGDPELAFRALA